MGLNHADVKITVENLLSKMTNFFYLTMFGIEASNE